MNLLTTKNTYTYLYLKYTEEVEDKKSYLNTTGLLWKNICFDIEFLLLSTSVAYFYAYNAACAYLIIYCYKYIRIK